MRALLLSRHYFVFMFLGAGFVIWANYDESTMGGILPYYRDFSRIILQGFDPAAATERGIPTFPMWGYGWLLLITENRLAIIIFQTIVAMLTVAFTIRFLKRRERTQTSTIFKTIAALCLPWYVFHATLWPYSIAANALSVSALLFSEACERSAFKFVPLVCSGVLFGLALNFRSDWIVLPFLMAFGAVVVSRGRKMSTAMKGLVWLLSIFGMLAPWALYTKQVTGEYLWRSTNQGHVLFIGLGQLPDNKWGISASDADPKMNALINQRLGVAGSSLDHEGDRILRTEFWALIASEPREYLRKSLHGVRLVLEMGFHPGGFFDHYSHGFRKTLREFTGSPTAFMNRYGWSSWRFGVVMGVWVQGLLLLWASFLLLPLAFLRMVKERDMLRLIVCLSITYQTAIGVFAYNLPGYTSNMLLFHMINISMGLSPLVQRLQESTVVMQERATSDGFRCLS